MSFEPFKEFSSNRSPVHVFNDGYVFNGHITAMWQYSQSSMAPIVAMFYRNFAGLISAIEDVDRSTSLNDKVAINHLVVICMTTLEKLVRDVFDHLWNEFGYIGEKPSLARFGRWETIFRSKFGDEIGDLFIGGHFTALGYLSTFRNCIVRQAGIIDHQTLDQMQNHPLLHIYKAGNPLPMDLQTIISLSDSVGQFGYALIKLAASTKPVRRTGDATQV